MVAGRHFRKPTPADFRIPISASMRAAAIVPIPTHLDSGWS
jgi:hypothetical protein